MKKVLFFLLFVHCLVNLHAQKKGINDFKKWSAGLSPGIVPIPPNSLSLQPSIEFFITPQVSLLNEISLQLDKNNHADSFAMNKKYFKYKAEFRYYFNANKKVTPYSAIQFALANRRFTIAKQGHYYENSFNDTACYFDKSEVVSPFTILAGQFGITVRIIESLYFDIYTGAGVRFVNTEYRETENLKKNKRPYSLLYTKPVSSYYYTGKRTSLQLNLGGRISYRF